ncbi:MAG: 30S ribosomal protein S16 [Candidatus Komeilibacteria bacterium]|nr:30S ribosomal protein S16 [Candidatus Komeilibacteria bacterium]
MLSIRFTRTGKKKQPYFRVILTERQKDPWGKYIELLGNYNPRTKEAKLKEDRIKYWLSVGAQATVSIHNLLVKLNIIEGKKKNPVKVSKDRQAKMAKTKAEDQAKEDTAKAKAAEPEVKAEAPAEVAAEPAKEEATETAA